MTIHYLTPMAMSDVTTSIIWCAMENGVHFGPLQCSSVVACKPNPIQQFATSLTAIQELTKWNHTHCYLPTTRHQRHSHLYHFYFSHLPDTSLPNLMIFFTLSISCSMSQTLTSTKYLLIHNSTPASILFFTQLLHHSSVVNYFNRQITLT